MATNNFPIITNTVQSDTNATKNTLVCRDGAGGIYGQTVSGTNLETSGTFAGEPSTQTSSFTAGNATDYLVNCTSGAVTMTMPTASANTGVVYWVMKIDSSGNHVTISGSSGTTSLTTQYQRIRLVSDGTTWWGA